MASPSDLPGDEQDERHCLGACLLHPRAWAEAARFVRPEDFERLQHQRLFQAMALVAQETGGIVDHTLLGPKLLEVNDGDRAEADGDRALATGCLADGPAVEQVAAYAQRVARYAARRRLIRAAGRVAEAAYDEADPAVALRRARDAVAEAGEAWLGGETAWHAAADYAPVLMEPLDGEGERGAGLATGLPRVDALTGGLRAGELTVLAARTGHGKSALAGQIALGVAEAGHPVVFATAEMEPEELLFRMVAARSGIPSGRLRTGADLSDEEVSRALGAIGALGEHRLAFLQTGAGLDLATIVRETERAAALDECALLIVDYLQLIRLGRRADNRQVEVAEVALALKRLAQRAHVPVLALAQLNRQVELRADPRPVLADLRESGMLEQTADVVWLLWRPGLFARGQGDDREAFLHVAKNRAGETGTEPLLWDGPTTTFRPLEVWHRPD